MQSTCNHKQKLCCKCGSCPRCPSCVCNGPKRKRGRPPIPPQPSKRSALELARKKIHSQQQEIEPEDVRLCYSSQTTPTAEELISFLGLTRRDRDRLPKTGDDSTQFSSFSLKKRRQVHELLDKILLSISNVILPGSGNELYRSFREEKCKNALLLGAVIDGIRAARKGSTEGKTLRALLCSTFRSADVETLLRNCPDFCNDEVEKDQDLDSSIEVMKLTGMQDERTETNPISHALGNVTHYTDVDPIEKESYEIGSKFRCQVKGCIMDSSNDVGTATGHNCSVCRAPVHLICCERVLGIVVHDLDTVLHCSNCHKQAGAYEIRNNAVPGKEVTIVAEEAPSTPSPEFQHVHITSKKVRSGAFAKMYQKSRKNWDMLVCNGVVCSEVHSRCRRDDQDIREALLFIFNTQNVQLLSWGSKRVRVDDKWISLPAVLRRKTMEHMFREYKNAIETKTASSNDGLKPLSRSAFLDICGSVTRGMQKRKSAVDYILGTLVYDNFRVVRSIVDGELSGHRNYELYRKQIDAVEEFVKFSYLEHMSCDTDPVHDQDFALAEVINATEDQMRQTKCVTCMTPLQVVENIKGDIPLERQDVGDVLKDVQQKILLYYGHQHRCYNQEKRIAELFRDLKSDPAARRAIVLMDYKMKFEPIRYREKTTEFFGKKGISWHGAAIFYYGNLRGGEDSLSDEQAFDVHTLFFDHIICNNMTQDAYAVCCLLDAVLARLVIELPSVKYIHLLSDNATCYQNDLLPAIAPFISKEHRLTLKSFVHTETQRGKSLLDAHFALAMMHINRYCNETRSDVTTPGDIVVALNSNGGVANCTAELVYIDRKNAEMMAWVGAQKEKNISHLGRVNEVVYGEWDREKLRASCYKLSGRSFVEYIIGKHSLMPVNTNTAAVSSSNEIVEEEVHLGGDTAVSEDLTAAEVHVSRRHDYSYRSNVTGIAVYSRARIRRQLRKRSKRKDSLPQDTTIEQTTFELLFGG